MVEDLCLDDDGVTANKTQTCLCLVCIVDASVLLAVAVVACRCWLLLGVVAGCIVCITLVNVAAGCRCCWLIGCCVLRCGWPLCVVGRV